MSARPHRLPGRLAGHPRHPASRATLAARGDTIAGHYQDVALADRSCSGVHGGGSIRFQRTLISHARAAASTSKAPFTPATSPVYNPGMENKPDDPLIRKNISLRESVWDEVKQFHHRRMFKNEAAAVANLIQCALSMNKVLDGFGDSLLRDKAQEQSDVEK